MKMKKQLQISRIEVSAPALHALLTSYNCKRGLKPIKTASLLTRLDSPPHGRLLA